MTSEDGAFSASQGDGGLSPEAATPTIEAPAATDGQAENEGAVEPTAFNMVVRRPL